MSSPSNSILVVEESSTMCGLLDAVSSDGKIKMIHVDSPEEGIELIENRDPFSVIWSSDDLKKSNGRDFLKSCNKHSPLSSRILRSNFFSNTELQSMVRSGELQSYLCGTSLISVVDSMLSAIDIGIEHHKINALDEFFDVTDSIREDQLETNLERFNNVIDKFTYHSSLDVTNRETELNSLLSLTGKVLNKFPTVLGKQFVLEEKLNWKDKGLRVSGVFSNFHLKLKYLERYLRQSYLTIENRIVRIDETYNKISERDKLIQKLKDEFMDE